MLDSFCNSLTSRIVESFNLYKKLDLGKVILICEVCE